MDNRDSGAIECRKRIAPGSFVLVIADMVKAVTWIIHVLIHEIIPIAVPPSLEPCQIADSPYRVDTTPETETIVIEKCFGARKLVIKSHLPRAAAFDRSGRGNTVINIPFAEIVYCRGAPIIIKSPELLGRKGSLPDAEIDVIFIGFNI
jgi:hypothetical protein